jgi:hypothetical protein
MAKVQGFQYEQGKMPGSQYAKQHEPLGTPPKVQEDQTAKILSEALKALSPVFTNNAKIASNIKNTESQTLLLEKSDALLEEAKKLPAGEQAAFVKEGLEELTLRGLENQNTDENRSRFKNYAAQVELRTNKTIVTHETKLLTENAENALENFANAIVAPVVKAMSTGTPAETAASFLDAEASWEKELRDEYAKYTTGGGAFSIYGTEEEADIAFRKRLETDKTDLMQRAVAQAETNPAFIPIAQKLIDSTDVKGAGAQQSKLNAIRAEAASSMYTNTLNGITQSTNNAADNLDTSFASGTDVNHLMSPAGLRYLDANNVSHTDVTERIKDSQISHLTQFAETASPEDTEAYIKSELDSPLWNSLSNTGKEDFALEVKERIAEATVKRAKDISNNLDTLVKDNQLSVPNLIQQVLGGLTATNYDSDGNEMTKDDAILEATKGILKNVTAGKTGQQSEQAEELLKFYKLMGVDSDKTVIDAYAAQKVTINNNDLMYKAVTDGTQSLETITVPQKDALSSALSVRLKSVDPEVREAAQALFDKTFKGGIELSVHKQVIEGTIKSYLSQKDGLEKVVKYVAGLKNMNRTHANASLRSVEWSTETRGVIDSIIDVVMLEKTGLAGDLAHFVGADYTAAGGQYAMYHDIATGLQNGPSDDFLWNYIKDNFEKMGLSNTWSKTYADFRGKFDTSVYGMPILQTGHGGVRVDAGGRTESVAMALAMIEHFEGETSVTGEMILDFVTTQADAKDDTPFFEGIREKLFQAGEEAPVAGLTNKDKYVPESTINRTAPDGSPHFTDTQLVDIRAYLKTDENYIKHGAMTTGLTPATSRTFVLSNDELEGNMKDAIAKIKVPDGHTVVGVMSTPFYQGEGAVPYDIKGVVILSYLDGNGKPQTRYVPIPELNADEEQYLFEQEREFNRGRPNLENSSAIMWSPL